MNAYIRTPPQLLERLVLLLEPAQRTTWSPPARRRVSVDRAALLLRLCDVVSIGGSSCSQQPRNPQNRREGFAALARYIYRLINNSSE